MKTYVFEAILEVLLDFTKEILVKTTRGAPVCETLCRENWVLARPEADLVGIIYMYDLLFISSHIKYFMASPAYCFDDYDLFRDRYVAICTGDPISGCWFCHPVFVSATYVCSSCCMASFVDQ